MFLFPPPFYFVFDISNLLSYIQNNFSYELARPIMGTIFLVYSIRQRRKMHMKQSPYQLYPQEFLSSNSSFYIMLSSKETNMSILWCVSNFFAHEKKTYSEKYEWASLSELSISALASHSCLHVQELYTTQTDTHTHTHTHIHTQYEYYYKNVSIILMFTYENKKYTRSSKLTM